MPLVLTQLEQEAAAAPLVSPYSLDLSAAVIADAFRLAGQRPPPAATWPKLQKAHPERLVEQAGLLAHLLASTSLRAATTEAINSTKKDATAGLGEFFDQVEPLTGEMVRANAFRREEFVRKWLATWGGRPAGESAEQSAKKLAALDYRTTLAEYQKAEAARKAEAEKRAQLLKEAEEREAAARGWRE
jgi:hypothetical protein